MRGKNPDSVFRIDSETASIGVEMSAVGIQQCPSELVFVASWSLRIAQHSTDRKVQ